MVLRWGPKDWADWLFCAVAALAGVALIAWLYVAFAQVAFPGDWSGWEGAVVDHIRRVLAGQPLYARPTLEFTPLLYGPVYYWLCAAFAWTGDLAFVVPRSVSLAAVLASALLIVALVKQIGGSRLAGVIGAGVFFAAAPWAEGRYALAHVDALQLALILLALFLWNGKPSSAAWFGCGAALAAAILTKQSALLVALLIGLDGVMFRRRAIAMVVAGLLYALVPAVVWLYFDSGEWAWHFLIVMPQGFGLNLDFLLAPLIELKRLAPAALLGAAAILFFAVSAGSTQARRALLPVVALIGVGWLGRLHPGSGLNVLMPMIAGLALLGGLGIAWVLRSEMPPMRGIGAAMIAAQFAVLVYDPRAFVPAPQYAQIVMQARQAAMRLPPSTLIFGNSFLVDRIAGSEPLALRDYLATLDPSSRDAEMARLRGELGERQFPPVVATWLGKDVLGWLLADSYKTDGMLVPLADGQLPIAHSKAGDLILLSPR